MDATTKLLQLLDLAPMGADHFRSESEDLGFRNVFGGQVLGQALVAASRTVEARPVHSLHAYFLRPGDAHAPIDYEVHRVRDGGSFSVRRVIARQHEREIFTLNASFQEDEQGFEHQFPKPDAPACEDLKSELEIRRKFRELIPEKIRDQMTRDRPIEIRPAKPVNYLQPDIRPPYKQNWFRALGQLPDDPMLHCCILAYASDFGLLGTSMQPHGVTFAQKDMQVASLDHAIWFHRPFRVDQWLLYDMDSPSASAGRGFNRGNIYTADGVLVASVCQEALIRRRPA